MTGSELRCFVLVLGVIIVEHQTIGLDKKGKKQDASDETLSVNSLDGVQGKLQKSKVKKDSKKTVSENYFFLNFHLFFLILLIFLLLFLSFQNVILIVFLTSKKNIF